MTLSQPQHEKEEENKEVNHKIMEDKHKKRNKKERKEIDNKIINKRADEFKYENMVCSFPVKEATYKNIVSGKDNEDFKQEQAACQAGAQEQRPGQLEQLKL